VRSTTMAGHSSCQPDSLAAPPGPCPCSTRM
jgi:hypothetical protein